MLCILSPSKKLETQSSYQGRTTTPRFLDDAAHLAGELKRYSPAQIGKLMGLSDKLAELNYQRYQHFSTPFTTDNATAALFTFRGDVYDGLDADHLSKDAVHYAQDHMRILSGLYGLLRPLDLMQPYRLEMGTRFKNNRGAHLYDYWGSQINEALTSELGKHATPVLINLASNEYAKAAQLKKIPHPVITIGFKEYRDGVYKSLMLYVKRARGMMARYMLENQVDTAEGLKSFAEDGYRYNESLSQENEWIFSRGDHG